MFMRYVVCSRLTFVAAHLFEDIFHAERVRL